MLKLEAGKQYVRRDGKRTGYMEPHPEGYNGGYVWWDGEYSYTEAGEWIIGYEHGKDIVASCDNTVRLRRWNNLNGPQYLMLKENDLPPVAGAWIETDITIEVPRD